MECDSGLVRMGCGITLLFTHSQQQWTFLLGWALGELFYLLIIICEDEDRRWREGCQRESEVECLICPEKETKTYMPTRIHGGE